MSPKRSQKEPLERACEAYRKGKETRKRNQTNTHARNETQQLFSLSSQEKKTRAARNKTTRPRRHSTITRSAQRPASPTAAYAAARVRWGILRSHDQLRDPLARRAYSRPPSLARTLCNPTRQQSTRSLGGRTRARHRSLGHCAIQRLSIPPVRSPTFLSIARGGWPPPLPPAVHCFGLSCSWFSAPSPPKRGARCRAAPLLLSIGRGGRTPPLPPAELGPKKTFKTQSARSVAHQSNTSAIDPLARRPHTRPRAFAGAFCVHSISSETRSFPFPQARRLGSGGRGGGAKISYRVAPPAVPKSGPPRTPATTWRSRPRRASGRAAAGRYAALNSPAL